jgi:hypothetical protein
MSAVPTARNLELSEQVGSQISSVILQCSDGAQKTKQQQQQQQQTTTSS